MSLESFYSGFANPHFAEYLEQIEPSIIQNQNQYQRVKIGVARSEIIPKLSVVEWDSSRILGKALDNRVIYTTRRSSHDRKIYDNDSIEANEVRVYALLATLAVTFPKLRPRYDWPLASRTALEIVGTSVLRQYLARGLSIGIYPINDYQTADPFDRELDLRPSDMVGLHFNPPNPAVPTQPVKSVEPSRVREIAEAIQRANLHRSFDNYSAKRLAGLGISIQEIDFLMGVEELPNKHQTETDVTYLAILRRCQNLLSSSL